MIRRDKIKPVPNVPLRLEVQTPWGKECSSQYAPGGVEWRFEVLHEGREAYIYLPAEAKDAWRALRPVQGEEIDLIQHKQGNAPARWTVQPAAAPIPPQSSNLGERSSPASALRRLPAPPTNGANAIAPQPAAVPQVHPMEDLLVRCFCVSAQANMRAWEQVKGMGIDMEAPIWEDVRAAGISLFIERNRREGGR